MAIRLGAVGYLNSRPLTWVLDRSPDRWQIRYDVPAVCAQLLHTRQIDLGLVPSIEYLRAEDYRFVPGIGVGSMGRVASVALFARCPVGDVRRVMLDTSSRTSVVLLKVLCRHRFHIAPEFLEPRGGAALPGREDEAVLLIGDPALDLDHEAHGLRKIDLGEEWTAMTGLPFVYAAWTGAAGVVSGADVSALQEAQAEGIHARDAIAAEYGRGDQAATRRAVDYLRDNVKYGLGPEEAAGLQAFFDFAVDLGLAPAKRPLEFY